mmetsp:Transcript_7751/g.20029  ORF Transcript_7751/g.20029 Transcript_7751/m.20029 type:complete len:86 (-) Transcript_7751:22-279(-)
MLHEAAGRGVPNDAVSTPGATDHPVASSSDDPSETGERFASSSGWRVEGAVRLGVLLKLPPWVLKEAILEWVNVCEIGAMVPCTL